MAEGQELAVVRLLVQGIMDRVVANECVDSLVQSSPVSVAQNGLTDVLPEQHGLAPSPASALANALSELTLQTPLRQRPSPEVPNGVPAVSSAGASTPQSAEVVAGVPSKGVLIVAPPAKARGADRSIGLCYDRIMEAHVGPAGRSSAVREQHMHGGDDVRLCKLVSSLSTRRFVTCQNGQSLRGSHGLFPLVVVDHVERPMRTALITKVLNASGLAARCSTICPRQVSA